MFKLLKRNNANPSRYLIRDSRSAYWINVSPDKIVVDKNVMVIPYFNGVMKQGTTLKVLDGGYIELPLKGKRVTMVSGEKANKTGERVFGKGFEELVND